MFKQRLVIMMFFAMFLLCGNLYAQALPTKSATVRYNDVQFTYQPDIFGAVLPAYDAGTPFHTDAPYFANVAPHVTIKFMRPNPARPDTNLVGELGIYRLADIDAYAEPSYKEVVKQLQNLDTSDLSAYATVGTDNELVALPFMPVLNAAQIFRVHPSALNFKNVKGIEYYTYYSQAAEPIIEGQVMYTYQGITTDGLYYLSFSMYVEMGLLETAIPADINWDTFHAKYAQYLDDTFALIEKADTETFTPNQSVLKSFIESISIK